MKRYFILFAMLATIPASAQNTSRKKYGFPVRVTEVYDGDTFTFDGSGWSPFPNLTWKVRVRGIDTPEKRGKCAFEKALARKAHQTTISLLNRSERLRRSSLPIRERLSIRGQGYIVWLSAVQHDKYGGRFDAVVTLSDGTSLGDHLIDAGLARPYFGGRKQGWCK